MTSTDGKAGFTDIKRNGWMALLPSFLVPYAHLARWDRPVGWWLLLLPCWWSLSLAIAYKSNVIGDPVDWSMLIWYGFLFFVGAVAMRGAGCTINDIVDAKLDAQVERTAQRPIPSGRVSRFQAFVFLGLQLLAGLVVLLQFNTFTIWLSIASLIPVALYPFAKRVTYWPQAVLGFTFNWGALVGWAAVMGEISLVPVLLWLGGIAWTIGYDTIYGHQDKLDDAIIGVRSTALLFGENTKKWVSGFYVISLVLWAGPGFILVLGPAYSTGLLLVAIHMTWQVRHMQIDDPEQCLVIFKSNRDCGLLMVLACLAAVIPL